MWIFLFYDGPKNCWIDNWKMLNWIYIFIATSGHIAYGIYMIHFSSFYYYIVKLLLIHFISNHEIYGSVTIRRWPLNIQPVKILRACPSSGGHRRIVMVPKFIHGFIFFMLSIKWRHLLEFMNLCVCWLKLRVK